MQSVTRDIGRTCAECAIDEFRPENVAPTHDDRSLFLTSQWGVPWWLYVTYRVGVGVLMILWVLADFLLEAGKFYSNNYGIWFIFATNWSFLLLACTTVYQAFITVAYFVTERCREAPGTSGAKGLGVPLMVLWVLYNAAANGAVMVTISYWSFLIAVDNAGFLITTMSRLKHTLTTMYIVFDLMFSAMPVRIFHVVYPLLLGAIYTIFNATYFVNDGVGPDGKPYAYYVMDWRNPILAALACSMGFIISSMVQFIMFGVYKLRVFIYSRFAGVGGDQQPLPEDALEHGEIESILQGAEGGCGGGGGGGCGGGGCGGGGGQEEMGSPAARTQYNSTEDIQLKSCESTL